MNTNDKQQLSEKLAEIYGVDTYTYANEICASKGYKSWLVDDTARLEEMAAKAGLAVIRWDDLCISTYYGAEAVREYYIDHTTALEASNIAKAKALIKLGGE